MNISKAMQRISLLLRPVRGQQVLRRPVRAWLPGGLQKGDTDRGTISMHSLAKLFQYV